MDDEQRHYPRLLVVLGVALLVVVAIAVGNYHAVCGEEALCTPAGTPSPTPYASVTTRAYASLLDDYAAGLIQWVSWCPTSKRIYVHTFRLDTDYRVAEPIDLAVLQRDFSQPADVTRAFVPGIAQECSYDTPPTPSSATAPPGGQLP